MVEVIHEHDGGSGSGSGVGIMMGVILAVIVVLFLFYYFGRGLINGGPTTGQPQIDIPDRVNVNVNQKK